jgi:UPF0042 nucleotide-binding protein
MAEQEQNQIVDMTDSSQQSNSTKAPLTVEVVSFGFKYGTPPAANIVLDVRFLKNPYWVEELRPLTGLDEEVRKYVLDQGLAQDVLDNLEKLVEQTAPAMLKVKANSFIIALGCTGGQHRSPAMVEALVERIRNRFANYQVTSAHRELARMHETKSASLTAQGSAS